MKAEENKSSFNGMDWVYGIWFCGDNASDWMGTLGRKNGKWFWEYRFRYHVDEKTFDSADEKNWYAFSAPDDSQAALDHFLETIAFLKLAMQARYGEPVDFVDLQCDADDPKIFVELGSRPWANVKILTGEEADAFLHPK